MFRILLTKYWVLAHLLVTAGTLCFVPGLPAFGGIWLAASLLLMACFLPPVLKGESFWLARNRAAEAFRTDIAFWASALAVLWVGIGLLNGPRDLTYAAELRRWVFATPRLPFLPSSIDPAEGVPFFVGLLGGLAGAVTLRTVVPRGQRLFALIGLGLLSGALAVVGAVVAGIAGEAPAFAWLGGRFAVCVLWLLMACVGLGVASEQFLEARMPTCAAALAGAALNLMGLAAYATPFAAACGILVVAVWLVFVGFLVRGAGRGRAMLWNCVLLLPPLFGVALGLTLPGAAACRAALAPDALAAAWQAFADQWPFRAGLTLEVVGADPMLGAGPGGFGHLAPFHVKGAQAWALWKAGGSALPCDLLRLLAERGMMGAVFLLLPGGVFLGRCLMRWTEYRQNRVRRYSLRYVFVLGGSLTGVALTLLAAWVGTPLHGPATLAAFVMVCACMGGWMPRPR